jgi:hypothetical protein
MKSKNIYKALFLGLLVTGFSSFVKSQGCGMYYPLVTGTETEMTNYDDKGKVDGKSITKVTQATTSEGVTVATVQTTSKDKKDAVTGTATSAVKCAGGKILVEMKSFVPSQSTDAWKDMDVKTDATWLELPQTMTVGMTLLDGTGTISIYSNGTLFTTMKISITNRKVASSETVTTAAGTFTCFKVTQDILVETTTMGIPIKSNSKSAEYYSAGTGLVKSETFNKNDKLIGYSELTKITK